MFISSENYSYLLDCRKHVEIIDSELKQAVSYIRIRFVRIHFLIIEVIFVILVLNCRIITH